MARNFNIKGTYNKDKIVFQLVLVTEQEVHNEDSVDSGMEFEDNLGKKKTMDLKEP